MKPNCFNKNTNQHEKYIMQAQSCQFEPNSLRAKSILAFSFLLLVLFNICHAQQYTQTIRGRVIDRETQQPLPFVSVGVMANGNLKGSITDESGNYRVDNIPVGRASVRFSCMGYETITVPNLEVSSGREVLVNVELTESVMKLEGVEVRAMINKEQPINPFASASARTFSVEEAQRYAGASYDVSRLAMNFAGVKSTDDTQNEIVIRGNSPIGMLFRLDGIDIPNPNHFGDGSATGGIISMLNVNTLANSDFITGAFPAEYSNTTSGVFDLKTRNGNNQRHEFIGQLALMGSELSAEGPISRDHGSSYLVNYRYSTVELLNAAVDLQMASLPTYQDGLFKLHFPNKRGGSTSLIGLGGTNRIDWVESTRDTTLPKPDMAAVLNYDTDEYINNRTGTLGITHTHPIGPNAYFRITASASTVNNRFRVDSVSNQTRSPHLWSGSGSRRDKYALRTFVNIRIDSRNTLRTGFSLERQSFSLNDSLLMGSAGLYRTLRDFNGHDYLASPFVQWQHRINQKARFNAGVNLNHQHSTNSYSLEPRFGFNWEPLEGNTFIIAYGLHSLATPVEVLKNKILLDDGTYSMANIDLGFTKSHHLVLGYDKMITKVFRIKTELYYQQIWDALVETIPGSFSMLNRRSGSDLDFRALTNNGTGFNYGLEITAEKFMDKGSYFLSTLSLFESKYRGSDNILRNTAFNGNYVFNLLGGKEFRLGKGNGRYMKRLNLDGKFNIAGGARYSPIDMEASRQIGYTQYDHYQAFSQQMPMYMNLNARVGIKFIGKSTTQEIAISINNLTNRKNPFFMKYDPATDGLKTVYQFGLMPDLLYRIVF
jgi:hypothetical protein